MVERSLDMADRSLENMTERAPGAVHNSQAVPQAAVRNPQTTPQAATRVSQAAPQAAAHGQQETPRAAAQTATAAMRGHQAPHVAAPVPPAETELPAPADILADDLLDLPTALMEPPEGFDPEPAPGALELDHLYNEIDKVYHAYARGCGLSDCAYWMLYDLVLAAGSLPLARLTASWSYSKQTINSAIKVLEQRGLVALDFAEGSRKSKVASLTAEGRVFCRRYIEPAIEAERRAFGSLEPAERRELVRLARRYTDALDAELEAALGVAADTAAPAKEVRS